MTEPTTPPQISPDGRFYWDGSKWAPMPAPPRQRRARWLVLGVAALVVVALVVILVTSALTSAGPAAEVFGHTLHGTFTLNGDNNGMSSDCAGKGGFDDIHSGAAVTVRDEAGKVIGTSSLETGAPSGSSCVYKFSVSRLPDASYYAVEVSHRGSVNYSKSDLASRNWQVELTLGRS